MPIFHHSVRKINFKKPLGIEKLKPLLFQNVTDPTHNQTSSLPRSSGIPRPVKFSYRHVRNKL